MGGSSAEKQKGRSKKGQVRYEQNPFLGECNIPLRKQQVRVSALGKDDNILVNQSTGEVQGTHVVSYKKVDAERFVKLFTANIALTFDLKSAGLKALNVLIWAVQHRAIGKDEVDLDTYTLQEFLDSYEPPLKMSQATFSRGISELEEAKIVAKAKRRGRYFVNPNFIFNGSRVAFTTLIEKKPEGEEEQQDWVANSDEDQ